jgi:hypothetical protein
MKHIKPIKMIYSGSIIEPVGISVISAFDNLIDKVVFEYMIFKTESETVGGSKVEIVGAEYLAWDGSKDKAYEIVAAKIGVEIDEPADTPTEAPLESNEIGNK